MGRKREREARALPFEAFTPDAAAEVSHQIACDRQTVTGRSLTAGRLRFEPRAALEDLPESCVAPAAALIANSAAQVGTARREGAGAWSPRRSKRYGDREAILE